MLVLFFFFLVFKNILGDTILIDDLDSANNYRRAVSDFAEADVQFLKKTNTVPELVPNVELIRLLLVPVEGKKRKEKRDRCQRVKLNVYWRGQENPMIHG